VLLSTRRFHTFFNSSWVAFLGSVASVISLIWFAYLEINHAPQMTVWVVLLGASLAFFVGAGIYTVKVRQENREFCKFMGTLHQINHDYRDALSAAFKFNPASSNATEEGYVKYLDKWEEKTIKGVCQKIAEFYTAFTHCKCTVTVKLIKQLDGKTFCSSYARSEENCKRDTWEPMDFEVGTGRNTAFDKALLYASATISHFHSWDLAKETDYRNQRDNWGNIYKSAIVVPIRSVNRERLGTQQSSDDIGFLCVDTPATQRLNNTWHVELLAGFADQMYNFFCLMRGRYTLKTPSSVGQQ
jgi:hypothetical protein